ncbi:DUF2599 domain-containing protein [Helcococcus sueciensis]|uniref:DUF2599 domain-containing protein n=1 Tax=Helcococcus sueciensis TaxID=241555 RepID=UPI000427186A|nr:DUF2599 domain-containing protein [Helcococcus sueciensis]
MRKKIAFILLLIMIFPTLSNTVNANNGETELADVRNEVVLRVDPNLQRFREMFHDYFYSGYFETKNGKITLTLHPKLWAWSSSDKSNAWMSVYATFYRSHHWANTSVMHDQFYCHARLAYQLIEREWNLEPWRTSMNPITCN